uniref:Protection of telomeres protein 1 ssDNA-binding domain-containing protein n=1 Tax=Panagrolaimus sp. ES5 TaxID=591445 RepID=A0AC34FFF6_9BILA
MGRENYVYTKLNEIEDSDLKEFHIYGIIKDVFHKISYDRKGEYQDEYRLKVHDGTTGDEDISVTAFVPLDQLPPDVFTEGRIARFHRLQKNILKNNGGFYLCGRIGPISSVLLFDIPTRGTRFKFNPCYRSSVNYTQTDKDEENLKNLISKADAILANTQQQHPTTSAVAALTVQNTPALRRSPRLSPQKAGTHVSKTQPLSAVKTPVKRRRSRSQHETTSPRRSARLGGIKSPVVTVTIEDSSEEEETNEQPTAAEIEDEEENLQQQPQPHVSPVSRPVHSRQQQRLNIISPKTNERELFTEISYLVCGNSSYYNILCQIVSCYRNSRGDIFLRVWDGTRNPRSTRFLNFTKNDLIYGDLKKEKRIAADKKLYEITCYSEHGVDAANLRAGDYIALINMHFFVPKNCMEPSMVMHDGEGKIRSQQGDIGAGRKVIKVTASEHRTAYSHIDGLIKEHEPNLPILEEEEDVVVNPATVDSDERNVEPEISDETWNEFLGISPKASPKKNVPTSVVSKRISTQASTITLSSDGSTQNRLSQFSPNRDVEILSTQLSGSSTSRNNHFYPRPSFSQLSPSTSSSSFRRPVVSATEATVSPQRVQGVFARRPAPIPFDSTSQISQPPPSSPKRSRLTQSPQKSQSTQNLLDKFKMPNDYDDSSSQSQHDELRMLEAITDSQMENMWAEVENAELQSSPPFP